MKYLQKALAFGSFCTNLTSDHLSLQHTSEPAIDHGHEVLSLADAAFRLFSILARGKSANIETYGSFTLNDRIDYDFLQIFFTFAFHCDISR